MAADLCVVGAGPAGLTASLNGMRAGLETVVFESESVGGELVNRHRIENMPGIPSVSGTELRSTIVEQFREAGGSITLTTVERVEDGEPFRVSTADGGYRARSVVVASGGVPTRLDVPGEETYRGRGVFYCAKCDGPLYADDTVAVAGSSNWAITDALFLAEHAAEVVVIADGNELGADDHLAERAAACANVAVLTETEIVELRGSDVLESLLLVERDGGSERVRSVGGLYVQQGIEPNTGPIDDVVSTTDRGSVVVDAGLETETPGIFAAGDVRQSSPRTVAAAIGDGTTAARSAARYVRSDT